MPKEITRKAVDDEVVTKGFLKAELKNLRDEINNVTIKNLREDILTGRNKAIGALRDEIMTSQDKIIKMLEDRRTEDTIARGTQKTLVQKMENHEKRIGALELSR